MTMGLHDVSVDDNQEGTATVHVGDWLSGDRYEVRGIVNLRSGWVHVTSEEGRLRSFPRDVVQEVSWG